MPEVQNVGAVDYAQYPQTQSQNNAYADAYAYDQQPVVYDDQMAEMQAANKSRKGATILGSAVIAILGVTAGIFIGKHGKASKSEVEALKKELKELEELKNSEAVKNYANAQKAMEEIEKIADENQGNFFGGNRIGRKFYDKLKELIKPFKKTADEAKDKAEEVADDAAKKAEENAEDAAKGAAE